MSQAKSAVSTNVLDFINARSAKFAERVALSIKEAGEWHELTYGDLSKRAVKLASYLMETGIEHGDRIAILSESKPDWGVALFGAVRSGAIVVPLDVKLTEAELVSILSDCTPKVVLADAKHLAIADAVAQKVTSIKNVFCVDQVSDGTHKSIASLEPKAIVASRERAEDEVALIVYTSGTTGSPKGVMTTFGNLIFQVSSFEHMIDLSDSDRFLSILPVNHLLELTGGILGVLNEGGTVTFCHSLFPQEIIKTMKEKQITGMVGVPLFFKTLKGAIEREIKKQGDEAWAKFQGFLEKADALPIEQRRQLTAAIHEQLGGHLRVFICGAAPLDPEVAHFYLRLGIPLLQGYGLTETSPVISGNSLAHNRIGSVGQALPGVEVRIDTKDSSDTEGEILTRGPHIMRGYYHRDDLTSEVIDKEGWFHTGDLGHLDKDGFLFITGRIKNLIVLGGGKKIYPEEVETALSRGQTVKEICVLSHKHASGSKEGTEEVCAVVVPADAILAENKGQPEKWQMLVKQEVDALSENLAPYKRPTKVVFYDGELPKTTTRKVKRPLVSEWLDTQK